MSKKQFSDSTLQRMELLEKKLSGKSQTTTIRSTNQNRAIVITNHQAKAMGWGKN